MLKNFIETIKYYIDKIRQSPNLDNGLIVQKPTDTDYIHEEERFGFVFKQVLMPSRNWKQYRSSGEQQKRNNSKETMACVSYSCLNAIEQIMNFMKAEVESGKNNKDMQEFVRIFEHFDFYDKKGEANLSDPFTAKMSGTTHRGNTFTKVCQSFRHNGIVAEKYHPTPEKYSWNEYYKTIPQSVIDLGKKFTDFVEIKHEWIYSSQFNDTKKYSPNTTTVCASGGWKSDKIHTRPSRRHNHAVDNDYYKKNEYDGIFDSYLPYDKKVFWNYGLGMGKIFTFVLKKKIPDPLIEVLEKYDGESVKCKESNSIYHLQGGKKKAYTSELCFLAFNVNDKHITGYRLIDKKILDRIPQGEDMQIEKSYYWQFLKNIKGSENRLKELIKLIIS